MALCISGCLHRNDLEVIVSDAWQRDSVDCVVDLSTSLGFDWDTLYYFSGACSLEEMERMLGRNLPDYEDVGPRVVFLHRGVIVHQQFWSNDPEWFSDPDITDPVVFFDTPKRMLLFTKRTARFRVEKRGRLYGLKPVY